MNQIPDMLTEAIAVHEIVISFEKAGFTRDEALDLAKAMLVAKIQNGDNK